MSERRSLRERIIQALPPTSLVDKSEYAEIYVAINMMALLFISLFLFPGSLSNLVYLLFITLTVLPENYPGFSTSMGGSMEPTVPTGVKFVFTLPSQDSDDVAVGDIISYKKEDSSNLVQHRVIAKQNGEFILKGDGNNYIDPVVVYPSEIISRTPTIWHQPVYIPLSPRCYLGAVSMVYSYARGNHPARDAAESAKRL